jgi:hypothetical protein
LSHPHVFADHLQPARQAEWVVYAKRPFAGPQQVLDYVGRYTHRIAIANQRLLDIEDGHVRFRYKDYRADSNESQKTMALTALEFIRRFLLHVLPRGLHRIRYYGLLGNRHRTSQLARCRELLETTGSETIRRPCSRSQDYRDRYEVLTGISLRACPVCKVGRMLVIEELPRVSRSPMITDTS